MGDLNELERMTEKEIQVIGEDFTRNKQKVIDFLLENVMNVSLDIPKVVRGEFE